MMAKLAALVGAVAILGVTACAGGGAAVRVTADAPVSVAGGGGPLAGAQAFGGHGRLAFVSGKRLYVLDGSAAGQPAALHAVSTGTEPGSPGSPAWSPDGRWLAFLVGTPSADGAVTRGALWLAGPDGAGAHQVLPEAGGFAWSPKADELAAVSGLGGKLFAVQPGRRPFPVFEALGLTQASPAWSPDGRQLAVAVVNLTPQQRFVSSAIDVLASSGGIAATAIGFSRSGALVVDGWWADGQGLFAWSDPHDSASLAANGLPLVSYPLAGEPAPVASTLVYPSFAVPGANGVTLVAGGDRYLWSARTIRQCTVSAHCGPAMNATPSPVNLDPAAPGSRSGQPLLAFVHGATEKAAGRGQRGLRAWYQTRRLWVWAGIGGNPLPVTRAGVGVAAPAWSADSRDILYVRDNALWLIPMFTANGALSGARAVSVVSRLFTGDWPNVDGYTAWQSQFAWHSA
jgi:hypothetical protein